MLSPQEVPVLVNRVNEEKVTYLINVPSGKGNCKHSTPKTTLAFFLNEETCSESSLSLSYIEIQTV